MLGRDCFGNEILDNLEFDNVLGKLFKNIPPIKGLNDIPRNESFWDNILLSNYLIEKSDPGKLTWIELKETSVEFEVEIPGFNKDDIKVELFTDIDKKTYIRVYGKKYKDKICIKNFDKKFHTSNSISRGDINCKVENGILTISVNIPQIEKSKTMSIPIS